PQGGTGGKGHAAQGAANRNLQKAAPGIPGRLNRRHRRSPTGRPRWGPQRSMRPSVPRNRILREPFALIGTKEAAMATNGEKLAAIRKDAAQELLHIL